MLETKDENYTNYSDMWNIEERENLSMHLKKKKQEEATGEHKGQKWFWILSRVRYAAVNCQTNSVQSCQTQILHYPH